MRAPLLVASMVMVSLAGCTGKPDAVTVPQASELPTAPAQVNSTTGATEFLRPTWTVGRWWDVQVRLDYGYGVLQDLEGQVVVSGADDQGYRVGSSGTQMSAFDRYFDAFYIGSFGPNLEALVDKTPVILYDWPLAPGKTWITPLPLMNIEQFALRVYNATIMTSTFEDVSAAERLRFTGETDRGDLIDYDYSAATGWMTYFRLTNKTTGRIVLSVDYVQSGTGYTGDVHHVSRGVLYERFVVFPPMDNRLRVHPEFAGVPPAERVSVKAGWDWIDEVGFLFTFPILVGAGTASYMIVRPDLNVNNDTHHGAGDRFQYKVRLTSVRGQLAGDWTVAMNAAGTAGAFVGLYGFKDEVIQL